MAQFEALWVKSPDSDPVLELYQPRAPKENEVHLKIVSTALNYSDLLMVKAQYQEMPPFPLILGMEICGEVLSCGSEVKHLHRGQMVAGYCGHGGLANEATVPALGLCPIPTSGLDPVIASVMPIAYGTASLALSDLARLRAGDTVIISGAAGGTGLAAVQTAAMLGARVIALARGASRRDQCLAVGATSAFCPDDGDLLSLLHGNGPADIVFDTVGGALTQTLSRALKPEGRLLLIGFASGDIPNLKLNHLLVKNLHVIGVNWPAFRYFAAERFRASILQALTAASQGKLQPTIAARLSLRDAASGLDMIRNRKVTGKIAIIPG